MKVPSTVALIALTFLFGSAWSATPVRLYEQIEEVMINTSSFNNPFTETELRLRVDAPSGRKLGKIFTWYGFHDGDGTGEQKGNVWKFRLLFDEPGTWKVSAGFYEPGTDKGNGVSRNFEYNVSQVTVSSDAHGHIRIDPRNPMRFSYDDGTPWVPFSIHSSMLIDQDITTARQWIDEHAARGVNAFGVRFHAEKSTNISGISRYHFVLRDGKRATKWPGSADKFDYTRFDVASWQHNEEILAYTREKGIKNFIWFGVSGKNRQYQSYGPLDHTLSRGNVYLGFEQKLFIRYFLARWGADPTWWHWTVDSEWEETGGPRTSNQKFQIAYAQALRDSNPWQTLISNHSLRNWKMGGAEQGWGLATLQKRVSNSDTKVVSDSKSFIESNDHHGIPVFNVEGVWDLSNVTRSRIATLSHIFAGGYSHIAIFGDPHEKSSWGVVWDELIIRHKEDATMLGTLAKFFNSGSININAATPAYNKASVSGGNLALCLAELGKQYIIWLDQGGTPRIDLSGTSSTFRVTRYKGSDLLASGVDLGTIVGGGVRELPRTPDSGFGKDWLFVIRAVQASGDVLNPSHDELPSTVQSQ